MQAAGGERGPRHSFSLIKPTLTSFIFIYVCVCVCVYIYIYTHNTHPYIKFILFLTILGLHCCTGFSLVAVSWGYSLVVVACVAQASHCGGFSCCGTRALGTRASVVAVDGLSSCGAWA